MCWYALRTRSRHECVVQNYLMTHTANIEVFLPTYSKVSQWKDRKKEIRFPLFPGYCFGKFSLRDRHLVLKAPGFVGLVGNGNQFPISIPEEEMFALQRLHTSRLAYTPEHSLQEGTRVQVVRGPLVGVKGVLIHRRNHYQLVISVDLLKKGASVIVDSKDVMPCEEFMLRGKVSRSDYIYSYGI